jgi:TonB-linked SusC/RagA family outer membrane protein
MIQRNLTLLLLILCLSATTVLAQRAVSGKVIDNTGEPLIGVNILETGTSNGTVTDFDGNYSMTVADGATLTFSYTGYADQVITVGAQSVIDVTLEEGVALDEIVVTALGISREKKSLSYSAQNVQTEDISKARALNVVNSLSGKVAGISVSPSGSGVGGSSRVILRGNRSIAGNSQPLYVIDGVPILGDPTNVNPDDIASISVLKGPNAAALYGNRANNGAIIITTKKGSTGGFKVSLNTTFTSSSPLLLQNFQNEFAQGNSNQYNGASEDSWGPQISGQSVAHWSNNPEFPGGGTYSLAAQPDNVSDFYQTGTNVATNLAVSGGTEKSQTYFSYTFTDAEGVVPGNALKRHNVHLRVTNKLMDRLTLDAKLNYIREDINNSLSQGESFSNPNRHILRMPRTIRTADASIFEFTNAAGSNKQHYWNPGSNGGANPYWTINRNINERDLDRIVAFTSLRYELTDDLSVQVRTAFDRVNRQHDTRLFNDSYIIADDGVFNLTKSDAYEWNSDLLLTYKKQINDDLHISLNAGANARKERGSRLTGRVDRGEGLIVPNFFALSNTNDGKTENDFGTPGTSYPRDVNSVYGFANIAFKNAIYLDITGRNDWSSTLPRDAWSFFYPSVGLTAVVSDLTTLPSFITFAKLRASWAEVGNDTNPFQTLRTASLSAGGANGFLNISGTIPNANLLPEKTKSIEVGADLRFINNKVGLDLTYYKSNSENQLFSVALPVGSGASQFFTNGGDVENKGFEAVLSFTPVKTNDFTWDVAFNFTKNNSTVVQINDERPRIQVASDFLRAFFIEQGEPWGNVFSRGFVRQNQDDPNSPIVVDADGIPMVTGGRTVLVANYNPDWLGGISSTLNYKNLSLSFLIDIRQGGSVTSMTNAIVYGGGHTEETLHGRTGAVFGEGEWAKWGSAVKEDGSPNNISITSEQFWNRVGGRNAPVGEAFAVDASNIRLRELVLGYSFPIKNDYISAVRLSVVGRNLFFFSNKAGDFDPEVITGTNKQAEGFSSFGPPTMRTFGVNVGIDF